jgi:glycosyltransferase involved in cell wall biosynthesis
MMTDADLLRSRVPGVLAMRPGITGWLSRRGTAVPRILVAPTVAEIQELPEKTPVLAAQPLDHEAAALIQERPYGKILPRIVPACFFPPGDGADVFGTTRRYHLEARPRLVVLPPYQSGPRLTQLLQVAQRLAARGGEMVLLEGLSARENLAPLVGRLGLAEYLVFLPELTPAQVAGVLMGADVVLVLDGERVPRMLASWALAVGNPLVVDYQAAAATVLGGAALWVYSAAVEVWVAAVERALDDGRVREELTRRALSLTEEWREDVSVPLWQAALTGG